MVGLDEVKICSHEVKKYDYFDNVKEDILLLDQKLGHLVKYHEVAQQNIGLANAVMRYGGIQNVRDRMENPDIEDKLRQRIGVEAARLRIQTKRTGIEQKVSKEEWR